MNVCTINHTAMTPPWMSPEEDTIYTLMQILAGVAYIANVLFALPINGYVLWLIVKGQKKKIASDFITLNQIVAEILLSLLGIIFFLDLTLSHTLLTNLYMFLSLLFLTMRPLVQSYICLEQYLATVHPVIFLRWKPLRYKVACCCVSWLIAILLSIVGVTDILHNTFVLLMAALLLFLLLLMVFCCFSVLRALKHPAPGEGQRDKRSGNSMKKKALNIILINLVYTTVYLLPVAVVLSLKGTIPDHIFHSVATVNTCSFVMTGFVPPIIYLYRVGKLYRKCNCL